jgi:mxaJ protein
MDRGEDAAARHLPGELWVCAQQDNLPFSNDRGEGLENQLAVMVAHDLNLSLRYAWTLARSDSEAEMLSNGDCDLLPGVATLESGSQLSDPYYRSSYVFVTRAGEPTLRSFDDRRLSQLRMGIQLAGDEESPAARALADRALSRQVRGYLGIGGNGRGAVIAAVARREIDAAAVWGPLGGYYAAHYPSLIVTSIVQSRREPLPFAFDVAMEAGPGHAGLLPAVNRVLAARQQEIRTLVRRFHVPIAGADETADTRHSGAL